MNVIPSNISIIPSIPQLASLGIPRTFIARMIAPANDSIYPLPSFLCFVAILLLFLDV